MILGIIFVPLIYLLISGIDTALLEESNTDFFRIFTGKRLLNSLQLALLVSILSTIGALFASGLYYQLKYRKTRNFFLLLLFFLFATAPIIYTALLSEIRLFYSLGALTKSVTVLTLWLLPLASGIIILMMCNIDQSSLSTLRFLSRSKFVFFTRIIFQQSHFAMLGTFILIFMMVFVQEEVPSFLGYPTYAEEFLSRIILMEKFESTLIYALPFITLALGSSALIYILIRQISWRLFQDHITPLNKLNFIGSGKLTGFGFTLFVVISVFVIFQLVTKVNFSMFTSLLKDNGTVVSNSFILSLSASSIATLLSAYLVNCFHFMQRPPRMILMIAFLSLYWFLPSSLTGLTLLKFSQIYQFGDKIYDYAILLYGYTLHVLPPGLVMMLVLSQHSRSDHLFKLLKIRKHNLFFAIILPMQWRKWMLVLGVLFFLVLSEITTTVLLVPPGFETIIVKIYNLMHYGDYETIAFLSLLQTTFILVGLSLFTLIRALYDKT